MALFGLAGRHDARSRHRWLNRFQTVLLVLTLVGIAAAAGSLLFGEIGLWLALATCALTLLIEPVVASAMTLRLYGTRPLRSNEASVIWSLLRALTTRAGLPNTPVPYYVSSGIVNAFATGSRRLASIALTDGLLRSLSMRELQAVLAHEVAHIANGDMVTMTLIQGVVNTFVIFISRILAQIAAGFMGGNRDEGEESNGNPLIYFAVSMVLELVFGILASIITMWFSRHREFHADAGSAKLVGREKMIAALQRLKTSYEPQEANSMMAFCINGKSKSLSELFMSHPPLDKRIEALRSGEYLK